MFTRILIPLDGSALAEQALGRAADIARAGRGSLDLVLVHPPIALEQLRTGPWGPADWDAAHRYLEGIANEIATGAGVGVTHALRKGEPVHHICAHADEINADLIVMMSHGRTGFSRLWFGSVADGVMRHANVPVLVLRPVDDAKQRAVARRPFTHVLIPLDGRSTGIVPHAIALAQCAGARMTLLRVVQPIPQITVEAGVPYASMAAIMDVPATTELANTVKQQLREEASRLGTETGLPVDSHVVIEASVSAAIIDFARAAAVDVIAMATHTGVVGRVFLGSVADKVARGADVPVLLYHPKHAPRSTRRHSDADVPHHLGKLCTGSSSRA